MEKMRRFCTRFGLAMLVIGMLACTSGALAADGDDCVTPIVVDFGTDLPYSLSSTTCGHLNTYDGVTCLGNYDGGEDIIIQLDVPVDMCAELVITTPDSWVGMAVADDCPPSTDCIGATDFSSVTTGTDYTFPAGTHYLMIDTWPTPDCADFDLTITEVVPSCGNGTIECGEECDDANSVADDGCENDCSLTFMECGNGTPEGSEECDDGNTIDGDGCNADCTLPTANDLCADKLIVTDGTYAWDNTGAFEDGPPTGWGTALCGENEWYGTDPMYKDIWFNYEATCNGTLMVDNCDSDLDTRLAVYEGCTCPATLDNLLACNDDDNVGIPEDCGLESKIVVPAVLGACYKIQQGTYGTGGGAGQLNITCIVEGCGNYFVEGDEECDDGNTVDGDGCESDCTLPAVCGDGTWNPAYEECDDGNTVSGDGCDEFCVIEFCGDGTVNNGEECDDSNTIDGDGCDASCIVEECGNGVVQIGEACDDANTVDDDCCSNLCAAPDVCGDGCFNELTEECEDGNTINGDGCEDNCTITPPPANDECENAELVECGSQVVGNNLVATDDIIPSCQSSAAASIWYKVVPNATTMRVHTNNTPDSDADDSVLAVYEGDCGALTELDCDDDGGDSLLSLLDLTGLTPGNTYYIQLSSYEGSGSNRGEYVLDVICPIPECGNGITEGDEDCDDGNTIEGDGCENDCTVTPVCGNGDVEGDEECDDGNTIDGDGCEHDCTATPALNDECAGKPEIYDGTTAYDLSGATTGGPDPDCAAGPSTSMDDIFNDIWYNYNATCTGTVRIQTCWDDEYDIDTKLVIYDGCDCAVSGDPALMCADDDPASECTDAGGYMFESYGYFQATIGNCYKVRVGTYSSTTTPGPGVITIECVPPVCGNDILEPGNNEECDDGNLDDGDGCDSSCIIEYCGDGTTNNVDEECDDGNTVDGDGCDADCVIEECGNGVVQDGEQCDDGNTVDDDCCNNSCVAPDVCADGCLNSLTEECDDGNTIDGDGCEHDCTWTPGPENDVCASATALTCSTAGITLVGETLDYANNDYDPGSDGCTGYYAQGVDVVYTFELLEAQYVWLSMAPSPSFDASLYIVTDCADVVGTCVVGWDGGNPEGNWDDVEGAILDPGVYYVVADSYSSSTTGGTFDLSFKCGPLPEFGACCVSEVCTDDVAQEDCAGTWFAEQLCADVVCPAANDDCANKTPIIEGAYPFNTEGLTEDGYDLGCESYSLAEDMWYNYYASATGPVLMHTCGSDIDVEFAVYEGCTCPPSESFEIACVDAYDNVATCEDTASAIVDVTIGTCYKIRLGGEYGEEGLGVFTIAPYVEGECGNYVLDGTEECDDGNLIAGDGCDPTCLVEPNPNDTCAGKVEVFDGTTVFTFERATEEGPTPDCDSGDSFTSIYKDVWFNYYASCTGLLTIETCDDATAQDTKLMVYGGDSSTCTCPTEGDSAAVCDDDGCTSTESSISMMAVAGNCYKIRAGLYGSSTTPDADGALLTISCVATGACCNAGTCTDGTEQGACEGGGGTFMGVGSVCTPTLCEPGNTCEAPIVVDFATELPYATSDTTEGRGDDYFDTCMGNYDGAEDIIYELVVDETTCVNISMTADDTYAGIAIHDTCPIDGTTCLAMATSTANPDVIEGLILDAGTYYLMADIWPSPDYFTFDLTIEECASDGACCVDEVCTDAVLVGDCAGTAFPGELCADVTCPEVFGACCVDEVCTDGLRESECTGTFFLGDECTEVICPPSNDTCEAAAALPCGTTITTDSTNATNAYNGQCFSWNMNGNDLVWEITPAAEVELTITMTPTTSWDPGLYVLTDCAVLDDCFAAADDGYSGDPETVVFTAAAGTTYYVIADGYSGSGPFTLTVSDCGGVEPTGACCNEADWSCTDDVLEADCAYSWSEGAVCYVDGFCEDGVSCTEDLDCVLHYNDACGWDKCDTGTGVCDAPLPRFYGDICGNAFTVPPNGVVNTTDILCTLSAFGVGNLANCPNADIAVATAGQCPAGNSVVNLTDILKVLDAFGAPAPGASFMCSCPDNPY